MIDPFMPAFAQRSVPHRRVDVANGNRHNADQARGRDPEVLDQPIVVRGSRTTTTNAAPTLYHLPSDPM
jgi:hypothetical protein